MVAKIFIKMKRETWEAIESGFKTGEVFDYPIEKVASLLDGSVGNEDHSLYAVLGDRVGEITEFEFPRTAYNDFYALADDGTDNCIDVFVPNGNKATVCPDLGALLDAAYEAFSSGKYKSVTVFSCHGPKTFKPVYKFS
jgi:hypothetical protein